MTKHDVFKSIDSLCNQCDEVISDAVLSKLKKDDALAAHVYWKMESMIVGCHQELSFLREYIDEESVKKKCFFFDTELIWNSDYDLSEISGTLPDDDGGIVSYYTCPHCGRTYEISDPSKEERETDYKDYWNG